MTHYVQPQHPRPNVERWATPSPFQGRPINWLKEYRESAEYRNQIQKYRAKLDQVPKLGEVAAMISEISNSAPAVDEKGRKRRTTIHGALVDPDNPEWVHADTLNCLHSIVMLFPGSAFTRNRFKNEMFDLIVKHFGSPYAPGCNVSQWYRNAAFAIQMASKSVQERRSGVHDRCIVPGLTDAMSCALDTCVAENAGMTLDEYLNKPTQTKTATTSGEDNMAIQDTDNKNSDNVTALPANVATHGTPASDLQEFDQKLQTFNPALPAEALSGQMQALTMKPARVSVSHEAPTDTTTATDITTSQLNKDTTDMTNATTAIDENLQSAAGKIEQASRAVPEAVRAVEEDASRVAARAVRAAQTTLNNAGDQLHAAANAVKKSVKQPSFWKKAGKIAAITAGVAAVGGAAYVAYRYFKDGQAPAETVNDAIEAAKQVVGQATGQ